MEPLNHWGPDGGTTSASEDQPGGFIISMVGLFQDSLVLIR